MPRPVEPGRRPRPLAITAVVPTVAAGGPVEPCLEALRENRAAEVIVVRTTPDGDEQALSRAYADRVIDAPLAAAGAARQLAARAATQPWIAFLAPDVILPPTALMELTLETMSSGVAVLQAEVRRTGSGDDWSGRLATHLDASRREGCLDASLLLVQREVVLSHPFDPRSTSAADPDLALRLGAAGIRVGRSASVEVARRLPAGPSPVKAAWRADGAAIGRLVRRSGRRGARAAAAATRVAVRAGLDRTAGTPRRLRYLVAFALAGYRGMVAGLRDRNVAVGAGARPTLLATLTAVLLPALAAGAVGAVAAGYGLAVGVAAFADASYEGRLVPKLVVLGSILALVAVEIGKGAAVPGVRAWSARLAPWATALGAVAVAAAVARLVNVLT